MEGSFIKQNYLYGWGYENVTAAILKAVISDCKKKTSPYGVGKVAHLKAMKWRTF